MKAVITPHGFPNVNQEKALLAEIGVELEEIKSLDPQEIGELSRDAEVLFVQYAKITKDTIVQLEKCKVIIRYGIGVDNVDLEAAAAKGIYVCNVPHYCGDEVADHTFCLMLAAARKLVSVSRQVQDGNWDFINQLPIYSLAGHVLGLIGCGYIAQKVAVRAQAFGMQVVAYDPWLRSDLADKLNIKLVELEQLCAQSDYISLHIPLTSDTHHFVDAHLMAMMKTGVVLINTARGGLIDEQAAKQALESGHVGMICLDVLEQEPPQDNHPLIDAPQAIITPHMAYYSEASLPRLQKLAAEEAVRVLRGKPPLAPVNAKWMSKQN